MAKQTGCLFTTFQNTSGATLYFAYLGAHGEELDDDGQYTAFGNFDTAISRGPCKSTNKRYFDAFVSDMSAEKITIVSTPTPVYFDPTTDGPKVIEIDNDVVAAAAPCFTLDVA